MSDNSNIKELLEEAWNKRRVGSYEEARDLVKNAEELSKDDDYNTLGRISHVYMQFESDHDNLPKALEFCQQSLRFYQKANNSDKIAHSTRHIADLQRELGNDADSESNYREAIGIYKANSQTNIGDLANALRGFALVLEKRGKSSEAKTAWQKTKELYEACNLQAGVDEANQKLDSLALHQIVDKMNTDLPQV
jgi:tetratricopeptide (TPR) repeat protein